MRENDILFEHNIESNDKMSGSFPSHGENNEDFIGFEPNNDKYFSFCFLFVIFYFDILNFRTTIYTIKISE